MAAMSLLADRDSVFQRQDAAARAWRQCGVPGAIVGGCIPPDIPRVGVADRRAGRAVNAGAQRACIIPTDSKKDRPV